MLGLLSQTLSAFRPQGKVSLCQPCKQAGDGLGSVCWWVASEDRCNKEQWAVQEAQWLQQSIWTLHRGPLSPAGPYLPEFPPAIQPLLVGPVDLCPPRLMQAQLHTQAGFGLCQACPFRSSS